jgi:hypothetical protein
MTWMPVAACSFCSLASPGLYGASLAVCRPLWIPSGYPASARNALRTLGSSTGARSVGKASPGHSPWGMVPMTKRSACAGSAPCRSGPAMKRKWEREGGSTCVRRLLRTRCLILPPPVTLCRTFELIQTPPTICRLAEENGFDGSQAHIMFTIGPLWSVAGQRGEIDPRIGRKAGLGSMRSWPWMTGLMISCSRRRRRRSHLRRIEAIRKRHPSWGSLLAGSTARTGP